MLTQRMLPVALENNELILELIRDTASIEVFTHDGQTMTMTFYEETPGEGSLFEIAGSCIINKVQVSSIQ